MDTTQLLKGVLDLAVLAVVGERDGYGYDVVRRLREAGLDDVGDASVYGTLRRLFAAGALTSYVVPSDEGPHRKYYGLNDTGRSLLQSQGKTWLAFADTMSSLIDSHVTEHRTDTGGDPRMSTDPTQDYLAQVREALGDLPPRQREELLEDLPGHLAETVAESELPLQTLLGSPQAYAAELRAAAGLSSAPTPRVRRWTTAADDRVAAAVVAASRRVADGARELPYGRQVAGFLPELRPGWWVLRGYLVVAVPAAFDDLGFGVGVPPLVTLLGSDLLGLAVTLAAIATSVRLGRRHADLPEPRRQLVVAGNVALVLLCVFAGIGLRQQIGYNTQQVVYASEASYLQGPDGGISNIYAFDADGRPLTDVQLFDQEGRPLDTLLLQAPDGSYAEPVRALDEYGTEVANVFPRTLMAEVYDEDGYRVAPVPRPAIAPRRLATPSPSPSPSPVVVEPAPAPSSEPFPEQSPTTPSPEAPGPVPPGPVVTGPAAPPASPAPPAP